MEDILAPHIAAPNRDEIRDPHWYLAYGLFRVTSIVQGIKKRNEDGNASDTDAALTIASLGPISELAWAQARMAGAP